MGGVGGVLHDAVGFAGASCKENVQDGWERGTDDLCSRVHCPLEGLAVSSTAVPVPDSDAAGQHTLNGAPVECGGRLALFSRRRKCRRCCAFLESDMVLVVQVRSSVMCTPRNLVLLTFSTVELSMVSGGWSMEFLLLKSTTTSFVFSTLRDRLLAPHHTASCATSSL